MQQLSRSWRLAEVAAILWLAALPAAGVHAGVGGGLRVAWGPYFIVRADLGYAEGRARLYADFGQVF